MSLFLILLCVRAHINVRPLNSFTCNTNDMICWLHSYPSTPRLLWLRGCTFHETNINFSLFCLSNVDGQIKIQILIRQCLHDVMQSTFNKNILSPDLFSVYACYYACIYTAHTLTVKMTPTDLQRPPMTCNDLQWPPMTYFWQFFDYFWLFLTDRPTDRPLDHLTTWEIDNIREEVSFLLCTKSSGRSLQLGKEEPKDEGGEGFVKVKV